jgi:pimeloyl-ACP methyl ester carboxylesterase
MLKEQTFDTVHVRLNYAEGPSAGPPLILLHGHPSRWQDFLPVIPGLMLRWQIYALDLRGRGASQRGPRPAHLADNIADTTAFLRHVAKPAKPAVLFGHSSGALAALAVAAAAPELVQAVIVGDCPVDLPAFYARHGSELMQQVANVVQANPDIQTMAHELGAIFGGVFDAAYLRFFAKGLSQVDDLLSFWDPAYGEGFDPTVLLPRVTCPTLLLQAAAARGAMMSDHDLELARRLLAQPTVVQFADVGHALHMEQPERIGRIVMNFLESL